MALVFYALFAVCAAYGIYKLVKPYWQEADIDNVLDKREFNSTLFEKTKEAMSDVSFEDAKFCAEKIEELKNSNH